MQQKYRAQKGYLRISLSRFASCIVTTSPAIRSAPLVRSACAPENAPRLGVETLPRKVSTGTIWRLAFWPVTFCGDPLRGKIIAIGGSPTGLWGSNFFDQDAKHRVSTCDAEISHKNLFITHEAGILASNFFSRIIIAIGGSPTDLLKSALSGDRSRKQKLLIAIFLKKTN